MSISTAPLLFPEKELSGTCYFKVTGKKDEKEAAEKAKVVKRLCKCYKVHCKRTEPCLDLSCFPTHPIP